jgi:LacI family gluconate utilization system Gnt-I transcriptional repressor
MRSVARLAGVSMMTVSRVLTDPALVTDATRRRVTDAIARLGYVPDRVASSLRSGRTGFIAAVLPTLVNANFADTAHGITETLRGAGYQLVIGYTLYQQAEEERQVHSLLARRPEAVVLAGSEHTRETTRALLDARVPVIEIWDLPQRPLDYAVGFSNHDAGRAAARFLLGLGHRRLGAIGPASDGGARDHRGEARLAGFAAVLREAGVAADLVVQPCAPPLSLSEGARAMTQLLERAPEVQAVFAVSDLVAFGAMMECARRGVRVPGQVSILGFGDFELGRQCVPALSTVRIDAYAIGERTGAMIVQALRGAAMSAGKPAASPPEPAGQVLAPEVAGKVIDVGFTVQARQSTAARDG